MAAADMISLAREKGTSVVDLWMPVPGRRDNESCMHEDVMYWECVSRKFRGSHGWCCRGCGKVIQWG